MAAFSARVLDTKYICEGQSEQAQETRRQSAVAPWPVELTIEQSRAGEATYPSGHLDAAAEVDVAPVVLVVDGLLPLLDVDRPGGGGEDDAPHGAGLLAGSHDAQHPFHRRFDHLVLQRGTTSQTGGEKK